MFNKFVLLFAFSFSLNAFARFTRPEVQELRLDQMTFQVFPSLEIRGQIDLGIPAAIAAQPYSEEAFNSVVAGISGATAQLEPFAQAIRSALNEQPQLIGVSDLALVLAKIHTSLRALLDSGRVELPNMAITGQVLVLPWAKSNLGRLAYQNLLELGPEQARHWSKKYLQSLRAGISRISAENLPPYASFMGLILTIRLQKDDSRLIFQVLSALHPYQYSFPEPRAAEQGLMLTEFVVPSYPGPHAPTVLATIDVPLLKIGPPDIKVEFGQAGGLNYSFPTTSAKGMKNYAFELNWERSEYWSLVCEHAQSMPYFYSPDSDYTNWLEEQLSVDLPGVYVHLKQLDIDLKEMEVRPAVVRAGPYLLDCIPQTVERIAPFGSNSTRDECKMSQLWKDVNQWVGFDLEQLAAVVQAERAEPRICD